jgi:hypothetical protein
MYLCASTGNRYPEGVSCGNQLYAITLLFEAFRFKGCNKESFQEIENCNDIFFASSRLNGILPSLGRSLFHPLFGSAHRSPSTVPGHKAFRRNGSSKTFS